MYGVANPLFGGPQSLQQIDFIVPNSVFVSVSKLTHPKRHSVNSSHSTTGNKRGKPTSKRLHRLSVGLTQVYTGDGKGKTSAAFGLALRAIGRGLKVYVVQFIKGGFDYGELYIVDDLPNLKLKAFGRGKFVTEVPPTEEDVKLAREAFNLAEKVVNSNEYDLVVLDEINVALNLKLVDVDEVIHLVRNKPEHVELILTGRYAPPEIIEVADLVTEMKEVKHPYTRGIPPRKGIEY